MLFRRTCKLVEFENANKALEKAKPKNQEAVSYAGEGYLRYNSHHVTEN